MFIESLETRRMMSASAANAPAPGPVTPPEAQAIVNFNGPPGPTGFSLDVVTGNGQTMLVVPPGAPS